MGTACTGSAWDEASQSGGAVLALLGHVLEDVPTLVPMSMTRLTVDIVRPVPVGEPLHVTTEILREGKKIQLVDLTMTAGETVTTRARALRIRDRDVTDLPGMLVSSSDRNPAATLPQPEELPELELRPGMADSSASAPRSGGPPERSTGPRRVVPPAGAGRGRRAGPGHLLAALPLDVTNLIGVGLDPTRATSINPDVTGHLSRAPVGEWVALTGNTHYDHGVAHGVSMAVMSDVDGVFGVTSTSQILDPR